MDEEFLGLIKEMAGHAIEHAKEFKKTLDYSGESISALDDILLAFHNRLKNEPETPEQVEEINTISLVWGCYLGETMIKTNLQDGRWDFDHERGEPFLVGKHGHLYPISKVRKRLCDGIYESAVGFYETFSRMANEGDDFIKKHIVNSDDLPKERHKDQ